MNKVAIQDQYPDDYAHCYGCGRLNSQGIQLKSYWLGEEAICNFTPEPKYTGGYSNYLYGGMIASLIDCHGAATAAAAKADEDGKPISRFVTASLKVDFLKPTPVNTELEILGKPVEIKERKVIVDLTVSASGQICAKGTAVMVKVKDQDRD